MRNTIQVHRNGGTKPASVQTKTSRRQPARKSSLFDPSDPMPTLAICARFTRRGKVHNECLIPDIEISAEEWERACLKNLNMRERKAGSFFAHAIREGLAGPRGIGTLDELHAAKRQALTLMQLMAESEALHLVEGDLNDRKRDSFNAGVRDLVYQSEVRLEAAFDATFAAIHGKAEVAS